MGTSLAIRVGCFRGRRLSLAIRDPYDIFAHPQSPLPYLNVVSSDEFSRCSSILIESRVLCRRFRLEMTHVPLEVTIVSCTLDNRW